MDSVARAGLRKIGRFAFCLLTGLALTAAPSACGGEVDDGIEEGEDDLTLQPKVRGSVGGQVRVLTATEVRQHRFRNDDGILTWEGIVDRFGKDNAQVHLVDGDLFEGHFEYAQKALGRPQLTQAQFFTEVQFPDTRRYMPFQVYDFRRKPITQGGKTFKWVMNIRRYNYRDTEKELADVLTNLRALLSDRLMKGFGEPLLYVYESNISGTTTKRRPHVTELGIIKQRGFEIITESGILQVPH